jgi:hypothetical protein
MVILPGVGDGGQRFVNAPHSTQQADKRRGGTYGGQQRLAELQAPDDGVQGVPDEAAHEKRTKTTSCRRMTG